MMADVSINIIFFRMQIFSQ